MSAHTLRALQRGLESLYRIETGVAVEEFIVDERVRDAVCPERKSREQLLVSEQHGEMELALFIDNDALTAVANASTASLLGQGFGDFLLVVEGVSHFVYTVLCAQQNRSVTALELELQAEVDKFATCLLLASPDQSASRSWRNRLFVNCEYEADLSDDERHRYRAANDNAMRYTGYLEREFVAPGKITEMLSELRRFYRRNLADKLAMAAAG